MESRRQPGAGCAGAVSRRRQAAFRCRNLSRARSRARIKKPTRSTFAARMDKATVRAKPALPWVRTRSRPRCSRLLIADSTAGCCWRASAKSGLRLVCAAAGGQAALGGHGVEFQPVAEGDLVLRAVKAAVEAAGEKFREAFPRGHDDGNRGIGVAPLPQDPVLEDELVLVLDDRDGNAQLHGGARLPLADPPRMFLEDRKDLLLLRDHLPLQDPPVRLVDLAPRMRDVPVEVLELLRPGAPLQQVGPRGLRLRQQFPALGQERVDVLPPGLRAPGARHPLIQPPERHRKMPGLTPT